MLAGEWRHHSGNLGHPRAQGIKAVLSVVDFLAGTEGVAGGELRDGRWLRWQSVFGATVAFRRSWGSGRLCKMKWSGLVALGGPGRFGL